MDKKPTWQVGKHISTVVSSEKIKNTNFPIPLNPEESQDSEIEYYGGYLMCESIGNIETARLISAAPDMLEALENIENVENVDGSIPESIWEMVQNAIMKARGIANIEFEE